MVNFHQSLHSLLLGVVALALQLRSGAAVAHSDGQSNRDLLRRETQELHRTSVAKNSSKFLYVLNGYPGDYLMLRTQGEALLSWKADLDLILTSHESVQLGHDPPLSTVKVPPMKACFDAGWHKDIPNRSVPCYAAEEAGKLIGATFLANSTHHGFEWLVIGDDDTTFFPHNLERMLKNYDHKKPYYFGFRVDPHGDSESYHDEVLANTYRDAFHACPPLGDPNERRYVAFDPDKDITEQRKDCNTMLFFRKGWFRWGNGGSGTAISSGLLDSIPAENWQKCIDRFYYASSDIRLAMCLALNGHRVQELIGEHPISAHKLPATEALRQIIDLNNQSKMCGTDLECVLSKHGDGGIFR